jgi:hypothetical protein
MEMFIVMHGDPVAGFSFVGPFDDQEDAHGWAEAHAEEVFWLVPLIPQGSRPPQDKESE